MINASVRSAAGRFRAGKSQSFPGIAGGRGWAVPPRIAVPVPTSGCIPEIRLLLTGPAAIGREFSVRNRNASRTHLVSSSRSRRGAHERLDLHPRPLFAAADGGRQKTHYPVADKTAKSYPQSKARATYPEKDRPPAAASILSLN